MLFPFIFRGCDVLVYDDLRAVAEIAELRLPHHQRILSDDRIAVLESEHALFGERAIEHFKDSLRIVRVVAQLGERRPWLSGLRVVHHSMALAERAAPGILPAQAHAHS